MALHPNFPASPYDTLDPATRWFSAAEELRKSSYEKLLPPLVAHIRAEVKTWRDNHYLGVSPTSRALLHWYPILPDNGFESRNWRGEFQLTLHIQDDVRVVRKTGNLFLTNIHRVYLGDIREPSLDDDDLRDYFLDPFGPKPAGKTTDSKTDLGEIVREIDELVV